MPDQETTEFLEKMWREATTNKRRQILSALTTFFGPALRELINGKNETMNGKDMFKWPRTAPDATEPAS